MGGRLRTLLRSPRLQTSMLLALALGVHLLDPQPLETLRLKAFDLLQQTQTASAANADGPSSTSTSRACPASASDPWPRTEMAALVDVKIRSRLVQSHLIKPALKLRHEAFRERQCRET